MDQKLIHPNHSGQWLGLVKGKRPVETPTGTESQTHITINLDRIGNDIYRGTAYFNDLDSNIPGSLCALTFPIFNNEFSITLTPESYRVTSGRNRYTVEETKELYPDAIFPSTVEMSGGIEGDHLNIAWSTDIDTKGEGTLKRSNSNSSSKIKAYKMSWIDYKSKIPESEGCVFRGQDVITKLSTSFHRNNRFDLYRYDSEDINEAHKILSNQTRHFFQLDQGNQRGAFLNLLQHHGYPTPLLDWTNSPYVAAFFAFHNLTKEAIKTKIKEGQDHVRIFVLDNNHWSSRINQFSDMATHINHVSIIDCLALENPRAGPQQAVTMLTNMVDIEEHILNLAPESLTAFDIPITEAEKVMSDLGLMGITSSSLFPGIDGACNWLKLKNFGFT